MTHEVTILCKIAQDRHRNAALWRNLWTILLWVFGAAIIIFLVIAIFFFLRQDWLPGALTTLGTIVQGVGIKWVADRRADAVKEEEKAYKEVEEACGDRTRAEADRIRKDLTLFRSIR
jgi:LPS O-antigen subunit length determinant protein (WzzB/FepE family)